MRCKTSQMHAVKPDGPPQSAGAWDRPLNRGRETGTTQKQHAQEACLNARAAKRRVKDCVSAVPAPAVDPDRFRPRFRALQELPQERGPFTRTGSE